MMVLVVVSSGSSYGTMMVLVVVSSGSSYGTTSS